MSYYFKTNINDFLSQRNSLCNELQFRIPLQLRAYNHDQQHDVYETRLETIVHPGRESNCVLYLEIEEHFLRPYLLEDSMGPYLHVDEYHHSNCIVSWKDSAGNRFYPLPVSLRSIKKIIVKKPINTSNDCCPEVNELLNKLNFEQETNDTYGEVTIKKYRKKENV